MDGNSELIRRQDAFDTLTDYYHHTLATQHAALWDAINRVPAAQPERKTGHWDPVGVVEVVGGESAMWGSAIAYHRCSNCYEQALEDCGTEVLSKYCPNCGAKMEGVE